MHRLIMCLSITIVLAACGLKGPLYLPEPEPAGTPEQQNRESREDDKQKSQLNVD